MTIYNLGSINADYFYRVSHLPKPGETLQANSHDFGLGGKGANQSVAAARAGREVFHIGGVGPDGDWILKRLETHGVKCDHIEMTDVPTGHAIINVDDRGENSIVLFSGSNRALNEENVAASLEKLNAGDLLLLQNETSLTGPAAALAKSRKATVIYSAAPFELGAVSEILPYLDVLILNEVEAQQYRSSFKQDVQNSGVDHVVITKGPDGVDYWSAGHVEHIAAIPANAVDTTGAGDCFAGYFAAGIDEGKGFQAAIQLGAAAASIKVGRPGTSDAFPNREEVDALLAARN